MKLVHGQHCGLRHSGEQRPIQATEKRGSKGASSTKVAGGLYTLWGGGSYFLKIEFQLPKSRLKIFSAKEAAGRNHGDQRGASSAEKASPDSLCFAGIISGRS